MNIRNTCAVMPALNEEKRAGIIIEKIKAIGIDVIAVDDGSSDNTYAVISGIADFTIKHDANRGKGAALRSGMKFAVEKGYEYIVTLDSDGQHDPAEIPAMLDALKTSGYDMISADRMRDHKSMPPVRFLVNSIGSRIVSSLCGKRVPDAFTGYRILRKSLAAAVCIESDGYEADPEMLIKAHRAGFRVGFIESACIYEGQKSRIRPLRDGYRLFRMFIRFAFNRMGK